MNSFEVDSVNSLSSAPPYWYEGYCPKTGALLRLPRTHAAEAIARDLMQQLAVDQQYEREGKMYGVLLVETSSGEQQVLKAFSGLLKGRSLIEGWVPPIAGRDRIALEEAQTLGLLEAIKQEIMLLAQLPERQQYNKLVQDFGIDRRQLQLRHQQQQQDRHQQRQDLIQRLTGEALTSALAALDDQSRHEGMERRRLKRQHNLQLQPLQQIIQQADQRLYHLKQRRRHLSRQLQAQMHATYHLTNFAGTSITLQDLKLGGLPTGAGDCCAPKLLHHAATHDLKPLAMAEFWWGPASGDKRPGEFYGACVDRCQPLLGFLLSGLPPSPIAPMGREALPILYEDPWLLVVDKPTGLLSVPGRYADRQDSVLSRLQSQFEGASLLAVHRLDQDTSGMLVLARDAQTHRQLSQQFQQRQVNKQYEALLAGLLATDAGVIDLPLWGDPADRPRQQVDWQRGKPSQTQFQVLQRSQEQTRVKFIPLTGRTHQLRVHAADPQGLGLPIVGDRLYGNDLAEKQTIADRLYLHARDLQFHHPQFGNPIQLHSPTPF